MKAIYQGIRRDLYQWVKDADGRGGTSMPAGHEVADISIEVDTAALAKRLGIQAMGNKSGQSKFLHGCVVVKVLKRERIK